DVLQNPAAIFNDPAFRAAEGVGAENVARLSGAAGMGNSGNKLADLFKFGTSFAMDFRNQKINQLLQMLQGSPKAAALEGSETAGQEKTIGDLIATLFGGGGVGGVFNKLPNLWKLISGGDGGGGFGGTPAPGTDPGGWGGGWEGPGTDP